MQMTWRTVTVCCTMSAVCPVSAHSGRKEFIETGSGAETVGRQRRIAMFKEEPEPLDKAVPTGES